MVTTILWAGFMGGLGAGIGFLIGQLLSNQLEPKVKSGIIAAITVAFVMVGQTVSPRNLADWFEIEPIQAYFEQADIESVERQIAFLHEGEQQRLGVLREVNPEYYETFMAQVAEVSRSTRSQSAATMTLRESLSNEIGVRLLRLNDAELSAWADLQFELHDSLKDTHNTFCMQTATGRVPATLPDDLPQAYDDIEIELFRLIFSSALEGGDPLTDAEMNAHLSAAAVGLSEDYTGDVIQGAFAYLSDPEAEIQPGACGVYVNFHNRLKIVVGEAEAGPFWRALLSQG